MNLKFMAALLALASGGQICKIDEVAFFSDKECTNASDYQQIGNYINFLEEANKMIENGKMCQKFKKSSKYRYQKASFSCLDVETLKFEQFHQNEDPKCEYPFPPSSQTPSFVAKSDQCILFDSINVNRGGKLGPYYIKMTISASSTTSGPDAVASDWLLTKPQNDNELKYPEY